MFKAVINLSSNKSKRNAIETANKGQMALKNALNQCSDGLKGSGVIDEE